MKLRNAFKTASLFFLFKFLDKALSGKVRFQSVIIKKSFLQELLDNEQFLSLFFSSVYDNRVLAKDRIALVAHILKEGSSGQMIKHSLDVIDKGNTLDNEGNYSSYEINKEDIRSLLNRQDAEVEFFIFRPVPYPLDNDYVSYQISPADRNRNGFSERHGDYAYTAMLNPSPPATNSFEMVSS